MIGKLDNFRSQFNKDIEQVSKEFITDDIRDYYPEVYTGKVVNNNDPEKIGRCRIRVYSIFDDSIPDGDLPWAIPDMTFVGSKVGNFIVPPVDAIVCVYFDKGDIYCPRYTTKVVDKANLPTQRNTNYPNNMVLWETDDGDYFTVNRQTKEITIKHNSGSSIIMAPNGEVTITATTLNLEGKEINIPSTLVGGLPNTGPMCLLSHCLFTGIAHTSSKLTNP